MKKDFLTVTPDSGTSGEVNVVAEPNPTMKERSTTLTFSASGGLNESIKAVQAGVPWVMLSGILAGYDDKNSYPKTTQITPEKVTEENGVLVFKVSDITVGNSTYPYWFTFYSDNSNTFTIEANSQIYTFTKNGKIHGLTMNTLNDSNKFFQNFMLGMSSEQGNIIKFNGIPIIKIIGVIK